MSLMDALEKAGELSPRSVPELRYLQAAAERVRERWPDVRVGETDQEREALAQKLRARVEREEWEGTRLSFVISAASAVFDPERRDREDLSETRNFLYAEIAASTSETFLSGLLRAYLESFEPKVSHTTSLAKGLKAALPRMSGGNQLLLAAVPELLNPTAGPKRLAERMAEMSDPFTELVRLGVRSPHGAGFMDHAHLALTALVRNQLSERDRIDWYINWLRPPGKEEGRTAGAEAAIEALIHPWLKRTPEDEFRSHLVETLIELYGDPRIKSGGVWGGIDEAYMAIVHRWLTREDMRFFTGVVDATQKDAMWPPRRDFWLKLYDEGKIDAAWAALSSQAFEYARQHLMRQGAKNAYTRVGYQRARQNTSLLIMKIGNKIMVDGCHSYRTHVFDIADPMAPKLFEEGYDCQEIMYASDKRQPVAAKSHSNIPSWSRWVRDMINADVPRSQQTRPYRYVARPRPPKPRYVPPQRPVSPRYPDHPTASPQVDTSPPAQDLFSQRLGSRPPSGTDRNGPTVASRASSARVPDARRAQNPEPQSRRSGPHDPTSIKQAQFPNLTDRMIAYGPKGAAAVLEYLEAPSGGRTRPALSPKSREGLAWVLAAQGEPPLSLRNSLEYLLIGLKTSGVHLDDLFASGASVAEDEIPEAVHSGSSEQVSVPEPARFPPLPDLADERLDLLRMHADALEELGMRKRTFTERKAFAIAVQKLKERSPDLRPGEIADLQALYGELRQGGKGGQR